jgi:hypothetical protein
MMSLQKNSDFDFVLKGRGFSRAVSAAKLMAALAAGVSRGLEPARLARFAII